MKTLHLFLIGTIIGVLAFIGSNNLGMTTTPIEPTSPYPKMLYPEPPAPSTPLPEAELVQYEAPSEDPAGAVFTGFNVEMTAWVVCVEGAKVYSGPEENPDWYLYSLKDGDPVTVRELDLGTRTFAASEVARYTKFTNLCSAE
jgi:hypothetical protein